MVGITVKLTTLLIKTVSKPIGNVLKTQAKQHVFFKKICIKIAQLIHSKENKLKMSLLGEKKSNIRPLNDKQAIENGASFLSEVFIFTVAGSLIFYEGHRNRMKSREERESILNEIVFLKEQINLLKKDT